MYILNDVPWFIIISFRFVYFCACSFSTVAFCAGLLHGGNVLERHYPILLIGGAAWFWSNMGLGLIFQLIFWIPVLIFYPHSSRHWDIYFTILFLLESIVGIVWWWSHMKLLLYVTLFAFLIYVIVVMCWDGFERGNRKPTDEEVEWAKNNKILFICSSVFIYFSSTRNFLINLRRSLHSIVRGSTSEISTRITTISAHHENKEGASTFSSSILESSIGIGQNVNHGQTQTVGGASLADFIFNNQAQGAGSSMDKDNCKIFLNVLCVLQSIVGILWLWSNMKLLFNLALLGFIIYVYVIVILSPTVEIWRDHTNANEDNRDLIGENTWWTAVGSILTEILHIFQNVLEIANSNYDDISNFSKIFWRNMYHSMPLFGIASEISIRSSTISAQNDNEEGTTTSTSSLASSSNTMSEFRTARSLWQVMIGGYVNQGRGTQTIGSIRIGDNVIEIRAVAGRDVIFNTYIARDVNRNL